MINILIGGDICPVGNIQRAFAKGNALAIFHDLLGDISRADIAIANLECPLISRDTPISKAGPVLGASADCINGLKAAGWTILNLANNHSYDHGTEGLQSTMRVIRDAGLHLLGAGMTLEEAMVPLVVHVGCTRIVFYSMAEREFSIADENTPGANPFDLISFISVIHKYKQGDIFIVLMHGGKEFYPYPSPDMIKKCRFMIDMGADVVICGHAHCPLPWEIYAGKPIIYGLGNLVFESTRKRPNIWHQGYLARLTIRNRVISFEPIPYHQSMASLGARGMEKNSREIFMIEMEERGARLTDKNFIISQWTKYCQQQKDAYLPRLFAYRRSLRRVRKGIFPLLHSKESILQALLLVQCETHREIIETVFKEIRRRQKRGGT